MDITLALARAKQMKFDATSADGRRLLREAGRDGPQLAYGLIELKAMDDGKRTFTGTATTVSPDRMDDVVEPAGAQFKLPIPFLYQHDSRQPIGWVTSATVGKKGIDVEGRIENMPDAPQSLRDRLDVAWAELKSRLVRGLSIGFSPVEYAFFDDTYGVHYLIWDWLELSMVTIPANAEATIQTVKSFDVGLRAATGRNTQKGIPLIRTNPPGASGIHVIRPGAVKLIPR